MGINLDDFPDEMRERIFLPAAISGVGISGGEFGEDAEEETSDNADDMKALEMGRLRRYVKKGKHLKRPFQSDILTLTEIEGVSFGQDASFQSYP